MRAHQISLGIIAIALFIVGCGQEPTPVPTATVIPTALPAAVIAPENTPLPTASPTPTVESAPERDLDIQTLLPPDAIRSIDSPIFFETTEEADTVYDEGEYVLGVEIDGDARAYSVPLLSSHEIVNDTVAGIPIAVTW